MIDIKGNSLNPRASRLSNFTNRTFVFDGVLCAGIEGILQALKCRDYEVQKEICGLEGREAKRCGEKYNNWKTLQILWWHGERLDRSSRKYSELITEIYDAVYDQDESFRTNLLAIGHEEICHSIGNPDMRGTVLTEVEMIHQLNRLRNRALQGY